MHNAYFDLWNVAKRQSTTQILLFSFRKYKQTARKKVYAAEAGSELIKQRQRKKTLIHTQNGHKFIIIKCEEIEIFNKIYRNEYYLYSKLFKWQTKKKQTARKNKICKIETRSINWMTKIRGNGRKNKYQQQNDVR